MSTGSPEVDDLLARLAAAAPPLPADRYADVTAILRQYPPRLDTGYRRRKAAPRRAA